MLHHFHHPQYPGEVMLELPSWEEGLGILWLIFLRYTPVVYNKLITVMYHLPILRNEKCKFLSQKNFPFSVVVFIMCVW